ncbi:MAG: glycosyltransferase family 39 protein, partial [Alphaproteobacteria bacterium]|nr:glycosyltransferase family 39 protein [Alphaproteobacteria bacterium]
MRNKTASDSGLRRAAISLENLITTGDGQRLGWRAYVLLLLLCLALFLPGLSTLPPVDRDEPRFAQAAKQMIESGNYTDIRFQNEARYKKPVGIYWLQAASVKIFSDKSHTEIWAYRLPSVTGASVAVLMTAALGVLLFGPLTGFLAAILLAGCAVLNIEARLAKTDTVLLACVMVAQYALARAYLNSRPAAETEPRHSRESGNPAARVHAPYDSPCRCRGLNWMPAFAGLTRLFGARENLTLVALAFWTAQGVGFLVKGPILLMITLFTLLTLWVSDKRLGWFKSLRPGLGLPYALLLVAPWFIAIMLASHGDFAAQAGGHDLLAKIWQGQDRGKLPPGLHLLALPLVFFPASLLVLLALPDIWRNRRDPRVKFCLGWIIPTWLMFELSLTKLPHYVMPIYPALAVLAVKTMLDGYPALMERRWRWLPPLVTSVWFLAGMAIALGLAALPYLSDHDWKVAPILAGVLLLTAQTAALLLLSQRSPLSVIALGAGSLALMITSFGLVLPSLQNIWMTRQVMQVVEKVKPCARAQIVSAAYNEPSLIFKAGAETYVTNEGGEAATRLQENACGLALVDKNHQDAFLAVFKTKGRQPLALAQFNGPNIGSGHRAELTLYRMPP